MLDKLEAGRWRNDRLCCPGVPALVVLHRKDEEHNRERERAVPQQFLHARREDLIGMIGGDRRPDTPRRVPNFPMAFPVL